MNLKFYSYCNCITEVQKVVFKRLVIDFQQPSLKIHVVISQWQLN